MEDNLELEAVLEGNIFLLYFMSILYILINKDFNKNQKILSKKTQKFVLLVLINFKLYVILADIGNEHSSRYVLPLHSITFVIRK